MTSMAFLLCGFAAVVMLLGLATKPGRAVFAAVGGLLRGQWWRIKIRATWKATVRAAGLSDRRRSFRRDRDRVKWKDPRLVRLRTSKHAVTLKIRTRRGQALDDLEDAGKKIAATYDAEVFRCYRPRRKGGSRIMLELVLKDTLRRSHTARLPLPYMQAETVVLGRCQSGRPFELQVAGQQTLIVGCTGSGKGSFVQGVLCQLAPAIALDAVQVHGCDLKGFLELAMCDELMTDRARNVPDAIELLRRLDQVIEARCDEMRGKSRSFTPGPGEPLHVLVIDELAMLTAYLPKREKEEAAALLSSLLSRGRAVGVVALAAIQDPRKEALPMRGLFSQVVALRLRSRSEVVMTLGDDMGDVAPAHRIPRNAPGTAWIVDETGSGDRVRADWYPDELIRQVAQLYQPGSGIKSLRVVKDDDHDQAAAVAS